MVVTMRGIALKFSVTGLVALAVAFTQLGSAFAQITSPSSTNGGSSCNAGNSSDTFCGSSTSLPINNGTTLQSRYAWNINADVGILTTRDQGGNAQHNVSFNATAPGSYRLDIATQRQGIVQRNDDLVNCRGKHTWWLSPATRTLRWLLAPSVAPDHSPPWT